MNHPPVAVNDTFYATGGIASNLNVIANDTDPDSPYTQQTFTISGYTLPSNGTLSVVGNQFQYTPTSTYYGPDTFTYTIQDQSGALSNTGTVNINVTPGINFPPVTTGGSYSINEDTSLSGTLTGTDINGDHLTYTASILPSHGTLSITGSGFIYTPTQYYFGTDSFTFHANDGQADSSGSVVNISIARVPIAPIAVNDTVNVQMSMTTIIDALANDIDPNVPDQLTTPTLSVSASGFTLPSHGTLSVVSNKFQYTPNPAYLGSDSFTYSITNQDGLTSNTGTVNITVSTTDLPPVVSSGTFTTPEGTPLIATLSGSDPDSTPVTFLLDTAPTNGSVSISSTGSFVYTPNAYYR